ncbi:MAG: TonB-dependent receptor [Desulfomonile tiedjei]|nr:TonB-dependent receptor [Desulfomonile tiedjei]
MKKSTTLLASVVALCLLCGVAYGQPPCKVGFDFFAGWQGGDKQTLTAVSDGPFPGALFRSVKLEIPNQGLWLAGGLDAKIGEDLNLLVQGWYFLSSNSDGSIVLDPGATPVLIPAGVSSNVDWWYIDALGAYRLSGPFSGILGLRFDHHNFYTDDPEILNILFFPLPTQMRLDLNVLSTIPYFGFQWGPSDGITLRAVYSPLGSITAESTLSQNNNIARPLNVLGGEGGFTKKTFFELFVEYSGEVTPSAKLAVFGRGAWLQGTTDTDLTESLVNGAAEYGISYHRVSWALGAKATVLFDVPAFLRSW